MHHNSLAGALRRAVGYIVFAAIGIAPMAGIIFALAGGDRLGLSAGVVFGVMAGIPVAILVLVRLGRRSQAEAEHSPNAVTGDAITADAYSDYLQPLPVIILDAPGKRISITADDLEKNRQKVFDICTRRIAGEVKP